MHGDSRNKRSRLLFSGIDLDGMAVICDGGHKHWDPLQQSRLTGLARAVASARYPMLFCKRLA
eukprot:2489141-Amphidinium_carterae.1